MTSILRESHTLRYRGGGVVNGCLLSSYEAFVYETLCSYESTLVCVNTYIGRKLPRGAILDCSGSTTEVGNWTHHFFVSK